MRKNFKVLTAVALTVTMTMGSAMTVFADQSFSGNGDYEGGEIQNPPLSVTLPTQADVNYIADPNDLLQYKDASGDSINTAHGNAQFNGDTGIYFLQQEASGDVGAQYSNVSAGFKAINKSRQDVIVTVKLEADNSGDATIGFAESETFASGDADRKIYLGIQNDKSGDAAITAAGESGVATFNTDLAGNEDNYEVKHDGNGYRYEMKADASGDAGWDAATYNLKGAANKSADWKDNDLVFPGITVTWSYAEKLDNAAPSVADVTYSMATGGDLMIPYSLGAGALGKTAVTDVAIEFGGKVYSINGGWNFPKDGAEFFSIQQGKVVINEAWMSYYTAGTYTIYLQYDNDNSLEEGTYAAVQLTVVE